MASSYIAWYLFLAGMGSGAFFMGAAVDFVLRIKRIPWFVSVSPLTDVGLLSGPAIVAMSSVFLVFDLGAPSKALNIFLYPSGSILSIGAWSLFAFCFFAVISLLFGRIENSRLARFAEVSTQIIAMLFSVCVMAYAGLFFSSFPSVPFLNTPWLVALFISSALAVGVAFLVLVGVVRQAREGVFDALVCIAPVDVVLVVTESGMLAGFVASALLGGEWSAYSVSALFGGALSFAFWIGVVALGIVVPLLCDALFACHARLGVVATGALCALFGGALLRFAVLLAAVRFNMVDMSMQAFWV